MDGPLLTVKLGVESCVSVLQMKILGLLVIARHVNKQDVSLLPNLNMVLVKFSGPFFSGRVFLDPFLLSLVFSGPVFSTWYF